jgi:hypothetical protein
VPVTVGASDFKKKLRLVHATSNKVQSGADDFERAGFSVACASPVLPQDPVQTAPGTEKRCRRRLKFSGVTNCHERLLFFKTLSR